MAFGWLKKGLGKLGGWTVTGLKHARPGLLILDFVQIPGVPPALQAKIARLGKASLAVAEAEGGDDKARRAFALFAAAVQELGIDIPAKKLKLLQELLLDEDFQEGAFAFDEKKAAELARAHGADLDDLGELIDRSSR